MDQPFFQSRFQSLRNLDSDFQDAVFIGFHAVRHHPVQASLRDHLHRQIHHPLVFAV